MHELSMARNLVDLAAEQLAAAGWEPGSERIGAVKVRIGPYAGVVQEALQTAFSAAAVGTSLAGATLQVESTPLVVWCPQCQAEQTLLDIRQLRCPNCATRTPKIVGGTELELVSIEVVDATPNPGSAATHTQTE